MNLLLEYHGYITGALVVALVGGLIHEFRYASRWRRRREEQHAQYREFLEADAFARLAHDLHEVQYRPNRPPLSD